MQVALLLGALEWLRTLTLLVRFRTDLGTPWARLALILGAVALGTALSALVFRAPRVATLFGLSRVAGADETSSGL